MPNPWREKKISFVERLGGGPGYGGCVLERVLFKSEGIGCFTDY